MILGFLGPPVWRLLSDKAEKAVVLTISHTSTYK